MATATSLENLLKNEPNVTTFVDPLNVLVDLSNTPITSPNIHAREASKDGSREVVSDVPLFFDKYSSFVSSTSPDEIIQALETTLHTLKCDIHNKASSKYSMSVSFYHRFDCVDANISIFRKRPHETNRLLSPTPTQYLVEVQRRRGESVLFSQFYRKLLRKLRRSHSNLVDGYASPSLVLSPLVSTKTPTTTDSKMADDMPYNEILWSNEALQSIVGMMKSSFIETQREGVLSLARGSCDACVRSKMCSDFREDLQPIIRRFLSSKDRIITRCAVICVEHMCTSAECREQCITLLDELFSAVSATDSNEIRRRGVRAIQLLSTSHEHKFTAQHKNILRGYLREFKSDNEVRDYLKMTISVLEPHMVLSPTAVISPKMSPKVPPILLPNDC